MSSDSSDDEDLNKLREAADFQFINDSMFHEKKATKTKLEKPVSLRPSRDEDEQFNLFHVSPAFRNYVAKHLTKMLDEVLQKEVTAKNINYNTKPKRRKSGIKLFHNSHHFIKLTEKTLTPIIRKINKTNSDDEDANDNKVKSVVVTPEDILSKKGTKHWSTRSKAPVYTYIQTKNGLILK